MVKTIGAVMRQIRRRNGDTLADVAAATGYSVANCSRAERDVMEPAGVSLYFQKFAQVYGLEASESDLMRIATAPPAPPKPAIVTIRPTAADVAAALSALFPDGPTVLYFGDDEGDE